jgi:hypothetical protein
MTSLPTSKLPASGTFALPGNRDMTPAEKMLLLGVLVMVFVWLLWKRRR